MIGVENLYKSFASQVLFEDASFKLNPKERIGLVGLNGHGKTTLFRIIIGEESPDTGTISIPKNYRIGYVRQHLDFIRDTIPLAAPSTFSLSSSIVFSCPVILGTFRNILVTPS